MKQGLFTGLLLTAGLAAPALGQAAQRGNAAAALPTLKQQTLQYIDELDAGAFVTVDLHYGGRTYLVDLEPHSLRGPDFRVLVQGVDGELREAVAPAPQTYRGTVYDERGRLLTGSKVAANLTPNGWVMSVDLPGSEEHLFVQPVADLDPSQAARGVHAIYRSTDVLPANGVCGADELEFNKEQSKEQSLQRPGEDDPPMLAATGQTSVPIAFDADAEYYMANGSSVNATIADIEGVMNLVEDVYERDTNITYEVTTIVVRAVPIGLDPYTTSDPFDLLPEMIRHWNDKQGGVKRAVAHLMTGKDLDGPIIGVANLNVVCKVKSAYGLSQSLFTTNAAQRTTLTAHELGHNFGAMHCDQNLLIECCTDCHIMCSGLSGCNGIGLPNFGALSARFIRRNAESQGCIKPEQPPLMLPFVDTFPDTTGLSKAKWWFNDKGDVTARSGVSEPSEPAALKLNANKPAPGFQDDVRTAKIDMSGVTSATLSFYSQRKGVEAGEQLVIEYAASGVPGWTELTRLTSDGVSQNDFEFLSFSLPSNALHAESRIRLRVTSNEFNDRWFIDDFSIVDDSAALFVGDVVPGQPTEVRRTAVATGQTVAFLYSLRGAGDGPCLKQACLGLLPPVRLLDVATGNTEGVATSQLFVPVGCPPTTIALQALTLIPETGSGQLSDVVSVEVKP